MCNIDPAARPTINVGSAHSERRSVSTVMTPEREKSGALKAHIHDEEQQQTRLDLRLLFKLSIEVEDDRWPAYRERSTEGAAENSYAHAGESGTGTRCEHDRPRGSRSPASNELPGQSEQENDSQ